jgi:hypothetical protein
MAEQDANFSRAEPADLIPLQLVTELLIYKACPKKIPNFGCKDFISYVTSF